MCFNLYEASVGLRPAATGIMRCFSWLFETASWNSDGEMNNSPKESITVLIVSQRKSQRANAICDRELNKTKACVIMFEVSKTGGELFAAQVGCFADIGEMDEAGWNND